jgi:hypothetical protein
VEFSDYRRAGPVLVPFHALAYGPGLARARERQVQSLDFQPVDRGLFSLPRPAAQARSAAGSDVADRAPVSRVDELLSQPERKLTY